MARADGPGEQVLDWVARSLGEGGVVRWRRLTGGVATATHLLTLASGSSVVLRRHHRAWAEREPGLVVGEAATLRHLERVAPALPVPRLLAVDADGSASGGTGRPAMVLSRLPGRIDLTPSDPSAWLDQVAAAMAVVHALPPVDVDVDGPLERVEAPWIHTDVAPPPWSVHPHRWAKAIERHQGWPVLDEPGPAPSPPTLVHGDFQHFNLLWSRGRLTGIVDWGRPHPRPLDSDLGHCRLNLAILYGTGVADDLLARYGARTGGRTVDPWWDLHETLIFLPTWAPTIAQQVGRRMPVDDGGIHRRVDAHLDAVLRRLEATGA